MTFPLKYHKNILQFLTENRPKCVLLREGREPGHHLSRLGGGEALGGVHLGVHTPVMDGVHHDVLVTQQVQLPLQNSEQNIRFSTLVSECSLLPRIGIYRHLRDCVGTS